MDEEKEKMYPPDISVIRFASVRAQEIMALSKIIENPQTTKLIFQKLPCHMRRRAMSHNPNRMPRTLREAHKAQMAKSGRTVQPKRPRRKYRRRPSRLFEEYQRRASQSSWLETHLWHAKRFHMTVKWGYRLPERSCARSHRFCYRSVAHHCLLMDISYMCCIEIYGPEKEIIHGLSSLCDPKTGLTFGATAFLSGTREGRVTVIKRNDSSNEPIGLVTFLWCNGDTPEARTLWTWSHPAFYEQFLNELNSIFVSNPDASLQYSGVKITLNKGKLNRFRLRGPSAYSVVSALFDTETRNKFNGSQSPGYVTGVEVRDPRMIVPQSRTRQSTCALTDCITKDQSPLVSRSRLWDSTLRDQITQLRKSFPDYVISQRRSQLLVPGSELPVQPEEISIPLIIVNAAYEGSEFVPGCDVILPAGWGTAFWLALIYSGGHAGGLKDVGSMNFEHGICRELCLEIDSDAGKAAVVKHRVDLMERYFRRPPKTRTNFIKLATPFPFGIDWNRLLADWMDKVDPGFVVLRDKKLLNTLSVSKQTPLPNFILSQPYLLPVTVRVKRGSPHEFSMICLPWADDRVDSPIREPIHKDPGSKERKILRQQHSSLLKNLAKKRKENRNNVDKNVDYSSAIAIAIHREKMRKLWLPSSLNLKTSYARPVIGFVTQGDFGLSEGRGIGRGYIVIHALSQLTASSVLVRNPGTDLYMWAGIEMS
uniref:EOG090X07PD n=1 Tax=Ceriodaphnia reticulata TaxID=302197 RepID=A0A4Y7LZW7_9CRUS|nr:EOG090X07PD [Ceriodaphnia reticulata]SVE72989.1 EOG090X07PD [Ceriodaphnia reticulata]